MKTEHSTPSIIGIVTQKSNGTVRVQSGEENLLCSLSKSINPRLPGTKKHQKGAPGGRAQTGDRLSPAEVVVGDRVHCRAGQIIAIEPRRNLLSRRSATPNPGAHSHEQAIVANVDQVIPVFAAADPAPHWNMLDRYLVAASSAGIPVRIVLSKADLLTGMDSQTRAEIDQALAEYQRIGYPVNLVSAHNGTGITDLREQLRGKLSVLVGKSGVGKTSLLNAIQPELGLRVNTVNQVTGKGRHTTTALEMFSLDFGGALIDTPGVREFGLWEVPHDSLDRLFPEFLPYLGRCRFGASCRHVEEPGCAIRRAATAEIISPRRYFSYLRLYQEP